MADCLRIAGQEYQSRLLVGTGKYKDFAETAAALEASGKKMMELTQKRTVIMER